MLFPVGPAGNTEDVLSARLGFDLLLEIIGYLDSYSLIHLLEAYPNLKQYTVLITDHQFPLMFFDIPGVKRLAISNGFTWDNNQPSIFALYDGTMDSTPIKLFELAYIESLSDFISVKHDLLFNAFQKNKLNWSTFVFVKTDVFNTKPVCLLEEHLDEHTSCKWHFGLPTHFPPEGLDHSWFAPESFNGLAKDAGWPIDMSPGCVIHSDLGDSKRFEKVRSLSLVDVSQVVDLKFPKLLDLSFIYTLSTGPRPIISGIEAPLLRKLVIHYNGEMPHMTRMERIATDLKTGACQYDYDRTNDAPHSGAFPDVNGGLPPFMEAELIRMSNVRESFKCFELARMSAIQGNREFYKPTPEDFSQYLNTEMSQWLCRFDVVHVLGVSGGFYKESRLFSTTRRLHLKLVDDIPQGLFLDLSSVKSLSIGLYGSNTICPSMSINRLESLHLMIMAPMVNLDWSSTTHDGSSILEMFLYRSISLLKEGRPLGIDERDWGAFDKSLCRVKASTVSIVGFSMGWLQSLPGGPLAPEFCWKVYAGSFFRIRPVVKVEEGITYKATLDNIKFIFNEFNMIGLPLHLKGGDCKTRLLVSPVTRVSLSNRRYDISPRPIALRIPHPPQLGGLPFEICTPGNVTSCALCSDVLLPQTTSETEKTKKLLVARHEMSMSYFKSLDSPDIIKDDLQHRVILHRWTISCKSDGQHPGPYGDVVKKEEDKLLEAHEYPNTHYMEPKLPYQTPGIVDNAPTFGGLANATIGPQNTLADFALNNNNRVLGALREVNFLGLPPDIVLPMIAQLPELPEPSEVPEREQVADLRERTVCEYDAELGFL